MQMANIYSRMYDTEEVANTLHRQYLSQKHRKNIVNICNGTANWNACDFIDYNLQDYNEEYGKLCWQQEHDHNCVHCVKMVKRDR